jgi:hypothetical protein
MTKVIKAYREKPLSERQDKRVDELIRRYRLEPPSYLADENFGKIRITMLVTDDTAAEVVSQFRLCGFAVGKPYDYSDDENLYERDFDHYGEDDEQ